MKYLNRELLMKLNGGKPDKDMEDNVWLPKYIFNNILCKNNRVINETETEELTNLICGDIKNK